MSVRGKLGSFCASQWETQNSTISIKIGQKTHASQAHFNFQGVR